MRLLPPCLALALALSLPLSGACQASRSPTPPDSGAWLPASAIRAADYAERRLPLLIKENRALRTGLADCAATDADNQRALAAKDSATAAVRRQLGIEHALRVNDGTRATVAERRAKGRFWIIVGETALLVLTAFVAVTH